MTNIAEGFERISNKEKRHFYSIARGSCGECRSLLYVLLDANYISEETFASLKDQTIQIGKQLTGLITSIERRP